MPKGLKRELGEAIGGKNAESDQNKRKKTMQENNSKNIDKQVRSYLEDENIEGAHRSLVCLLGITIEAYLKQTDYFASDWAFENNALQIIELLIEETEERPSHLLTIVGHDDYSAFKDFIQYNLQHPPSEEGDAKDRTIQVIKKIVEIDFLGNVANVIDQVIKAHKANSATQQANAFEADLKKSIPDLNQLFSNNQSFFNQKKEIDEGKKIKKVSFKLD